MNNTFKIPKTLNICGHTIKIIYCNKIIDENGNECWGDWDINTEIIRLTKGMAKGRRMEILLHEVLHAIEDINGVVVKEDNIRLLALGLLGFIRDNNIDFLK